ncbi:hypothetical protein ACFLWT_00250 [Chloroflexota bacterium]
MYAYLRYGGHIAILAGREKDVLDVGKAHSIADVISKLDRKHTGFKDIFMPKGKIFNFNTAIYIRRVGEPSISVIDENEKVKEGDIIYFW